MQEMSRRVIQITNVEFQVEKTQNFKVTDCDKKRSGLWNKFILLIGFAIRHRCIGFESQSKILEDKVKPDSNSKDKKSNPASFHRIFKACPAVDYNEQAGPKITCDDHLIAEFQWANQKKKTTGSFRYLYKLSSSTIF